MPVHRRGALGRAGAAAGRRHRPRAAGGPARQRPALGILGVQKEVVLASARSIVTVEEIVDELEPRPGVTVLPSSVVGAVALAPGGAHPSYAHGYYDRDNDFYVAWDAISRDRDRFTQWMQQHVRDSGRPRVPREPPSRGNSGMKSRVPTPLWRHRHIATTVSGTNRRPACPGEPLRGRMTPHNKTIRVPFWCLTPGHVCSGGRAPISDVSVVCRAEPLIGCGDIGTRLTKWPRHERERLLRRRDDRRRSGAKARQ